MTLVPSGIRVVRSEFRFGQKPGNRHNVSRRVGIHRAVSLTRSCFALLLPAWSNVAEEELGSRTDETRRSALHHQRAIAVEIGTKCGTTSWTGFPSAVLMLIGLRERETGSYTFRLIRIGCGLRWAGLGPGTEGTDLGVSRLDWKWGLVSSLLGPSAATHARWDDSSCISVSEYLK